MGSFGRCSSNCRRQDQIRLISSPTPKTCPLHMAPGRHHLPLVNRRRAVADLLHLRITDSGALRGIQLHARIARDGERLIWAWLISKGSPGWRRLWLPVGRWSSLKSGLATYPEIMDPASNAGFNFHVIPIQ